MKPVLTLIIEEFNVDTEAYSIRIIRYTKSTLAGVIRNAGIERKRAENSLLPVIIDAMRIEDSDERVLWKDRS